MAQVPIFVRTSSLKFLIPPGSYVSMSHIVQYLDHISIHMYSTNNLVLYLPVGTGDLVRSAPERVGQLRSILFRPRRHVIAHVDVACENTLLQLLVGVFVHLQQSISPGRRPQRTWFNDDVQESRFVAQESLLSVYSGTLIQLVGFNTLQRSN